MTTTEVRPTETAQDEHDSGGTTNRDRLIGAASILAPTVLAAILVLHDLGSRSLWVDEGASWGYSSQHGIALWHAVTADGGNMLAYYAGLHVWMRLAGSSPAALRLPSALAVVATVPTCVVLVRRLFDRWAATVAGFFVAGSLSLVYWGQQARAYTFAVLLISVSTLTFVIALQTGRRLAWAAYVLASVLAVWTILLAAFMLAAQYCCLVFRSREDLPRRRLAIAAGCMVAGCAPVAAIAVQHGSAQLNWLKPSGPPLDATNWYLLRFLASAEQGGAPISGEAHLLTVLTVAAWLLAGALLIRTIARKGARADETFAWGLLIALFVLPALATYAVSELVHPVFNDRYLLLEGAFASLVAGVACSRIRPVVLAGAAATVLVALRIVVLVPSYGVPIETWKTVTASIVHQSRPGDCAAFFVADGFTVFDYYVLHGAAAAHGALPRPVLPDVAWSPPHAYELDPATIPSSRMASVVASCPRLWLIESHEAGQPPGPGVPSYQVAKRAAYHRLVTELHASFSRVSLTIDATIRVVLYERRQVPGT